MNKLLGKHDSLDRKSQENLRVLFALMAMGGKSDRAIAKILGINNTTLSRRKRKLEQEGYIKEYTLLPDFYKMGFEVVVFAFASTTDVIPQENSKFLQEMSQNNPELLCVLEDQDNSGTNWFTISVHKNYDEFVELYKKIQKELISLHHLPRVESKRLVFHTNKLGPKPFSLRYMDSLVKLNPAGNKRQGKKTKIIKT